MGIARVPDAAVAGGAYSEASVQTPTPSKRLQPLLQCSDSARLNTGTRQSTISVNVRLCLVQRGSQPVALSVAQLGCVSLAQLGQSMSVKL